MIHELNNLYNTIVYELYNILKPNIMEQNIYSADIDYIKMEEGKLNTIYIKINEKKSPITNAAVVENCV
tara:strand:- start:6331 stop:6537 length:207 start_codon:yes stop_codon:yes gene_type:complete